VPAAVGVTDAEFGVTAVDSGVTPPEIVGPTVPAAAPAPPPKSSLPTGESVAHPNNGMRTIVVSGQRANQKACIAILQSLD
jgi:hypothetical protein